jgi:citronellol/citronellal dehydrogenase
MGKDGEKFSLKYAYQVLSTCLIRKKIGYLCSRIALLYWKMSKNPHTINLSSPLNLNQKRFKTHVEYTMTKYRMRMCVLVMAE